MKIKAVITLESSNIYEAIHSIKKHLKHRLPEVIEAKPCFEKQELKTFPDIRERIKALAGAYNIDLVKLGKTLKED